jgi:hypothetical protein
VEVCARALLMSSRLEVEDPCSKFVVDIDVGAAVGEDGLDLCLLFFLYL